MNQRYAVPFTRMAGQRLPHSLTDMLDEALLHVGPPPSVGVILTADPMRYVRALLQEIRTDAALLEERKAENSNPSPVKDRSG